jgi:hypothetical protein
MPKVTAKGFHTAREAELFAAGIGFVNDSAIWNMWVTDSPPYVVTFDDSDQDDDLTIDFSGEIIT